MGDFALIMAVLTQTYQRLTSIYLKIPCSFTQKALENGFFVGTAPRTLPSGLAGRCSAQTGILTARIQHTTGFRAILTTTPGEITRFPQCGLQPLGITPGGDRDFPG